MFPGRAADRCLKRPSNDCISKSASTLQANSESAAGHNPFALDKDQHVDRPRTPGSEPQPLIERTLPARPCIVAAGIARPETSAAIKQVWQSPHMREIAMSSDLARHTAAKILHAHGSHSQALDIANAILAAQQARRSPVPMQPDTATSRALAEILHSLRSEERRKA